MPLAFARAGTARILSASIADVLQGGGADEPAGRSAHTPGRAIWSGPACSAETAPAGDVRLFGRDR